MKKINNAQEIWREIAFRQIPEWVDKLQEMPGVTGVSCSVLTTVAVRDVQEDIELDNAIDTERFSVDYAGVCEVGLTAFRGGLKIPFKAGIRLIPTAASEEPALRKHLEGVVHKSLQQIYEQICTQILVGPICADA